MSVQCPPIIKKASVLISLVCKLRIPTRFLRCQPFHPALTVTVFRVLDILAGVKERYAIEAPVHISGMRDIVSADYSQQPVILPDSDFLFAGLSTPVGFIHVGMLSQQCLDLLV